MTNEHLTRAIGPLPGPESVTMRGPADMAELLPYLMGFFPDDSIVAVGLQGPDLHQGGVIRLDIPESPEDWQEAARDTAALLIGLSVQRDRRPQQVLLYLCQDPVTGHGPPVDRLRPLADELQAAFESSAVMVKESLCVSDGRWWSFLCRRDGCCDPAGNPIRRSAGGPGPVAAAAAFAGLAPRGSRKAIVAGLAPAGPPVADAQRLAFGVVLARAAEEEAGAGDAAAGAEARRERAAVLLDQALAEFAAGARELDAERTALLLVALQDRPFRDRAAEYAEPGELATAQRLWRFLARRCVPPYAGYASPPLTLLAWTSWIAGDAATARVVLGHIIRLDPSYLLAKLLYESLNSGLSPELLLDGVRAERARRTEAARQRASGEEAQEDPPAAGPDPTGAEEPAPDRPGGGKPPSPTARRAALVPAAPPAALAARDVSEAPATEAVVEAETTQAAPQQAPGVGGTGGTPDVRGTADARGGAVARHAPQVRTQTHRVPGCRPSGRAAAPCGHPVAGGPSPAKLRLGRVPRQAPPGVRAGCRGVRGPAKGSRHAV